MAILAGPESRTGRRVSTARALLPFVALLGGVCEWALASDALATPARVIREISGDLQVEQIAPGVWVHTSWKLYDSGTRVPSNGLIVRDGEQVVLVDTAWGVEVTEQLLDWIDDRLGLEVSGVVATHTHEDRMGGASVLAARGIPLLAQSRSVALATADGIATAESLGDLAVGEALTVGALEVFYPGPGHSSDNVVVWLPGARILFGGCAVKSARSSGLGNVADADLESWPLAIRRMLERYGSASTVVPGHGARGDSALLVHTLELLED